MNTPRVSTESLSALIQGRRAAPGSGRDIEAPTASPADRAPAADSTRLGTLGWASRQGNAFLAGVAAAKSLDALDEVDALLNELEGLVAQSAKAAPDALDGVRARIDAVVGTINRAAEQATGRGSAERGTIEYSRGSGSQQFPPSPFAFSNIAAGTEQVRANALLAPGGSLDVNVQVTVSAQQAGFYLSLGGETINLSAPLARFVIEISSNWGVQELSFASGTSIGAMRDAINSFTGATGVVAAASGTGLTVKSIEYGDDQFVSVRMIDTGGINTAIAQAGVYTLQGQNNKAANLIGQTLFSAASNLVQDIGQDIDGIVNGWNAVGNGRSLYAVTQNLQTQFRLSGAAAQSNQPFRAYTISRAAAAGNEPPAIDPKSISQGGAAAVAELQRARQSNARARETLLQIREAHREAAAAMLPTSIPAKSSPLDPARVRALLTPRSVSK